MTGPDPGSFRDPWSRVHVVDGEILRGLSAEGLAEFEAVAATDLLDRAVDDGLVVGTERLPDGSHALHDRWDAVLRHERLATISYPYEWSFEMLRDAALTHLEVSRRAVAAGFSTKDASSFNISFDGIRPVFIDIGSFERPDRRRPWSGYLQFCELFLNPLVLQSQADIAYHAWLRGAVGGIAAADVCSAVPLRRRLFGGLGVHVTNLARTQRKQQAAEAADPNAAVRTAGFAPKLVAAQIDSLEKTVRGLTWKAQRSVWSDYSDRSHYGTELPQKERFVQEAVRAVDATEVVDLGANDGHFSLLAAEAGADRVIAVDFDHLVIDRLYRHLRDTGETRILPLVQDLMNPSAGAGWRGRERTPFQSRVNPDLVLCLAVVHHLAITDTVPFSEIIGFLRDFDAPMVVEFPHHDDPMVRRLLSRKRPGLFDHYRRDLWEEALAEHFEVVEQLGLETRTLYRVTPRTV